jgi:phosphate uptake regulator
MELECSGLLITGKGGFSFRMERRSVKITVRFTPEEAEEINQAAEAKGLTVSELIRRSVLGLPVPKRMSSKRLAKKNEVFREYLSELNRIGVNINQIARYCNRYREVDVLVLESLINIERKLSEMLNKLYAELIG